VPLGVVAARGVPVQDGERGDESDAERGPAQERGRSVDDLGDDGDDRHGTGDERHGAHRERERHGPHLHEAAALLLVVGGVERVDEVLHPLGR
jgi:hypothetical protein